LTRRVRRTRPNDDLLEGERGRALAQILALRLEVCARLRLRDRRRAALTLQRTEVQLDHPLATDLLAELLAVLVHRHARLADRLREGQLAAKSPTLPRDLPLDEPVDLVVVDDDRVAQRGLNDEEFVDRRLERFAIEAVERRRVLGHL